MKCPIISVIVPVYNVEQFVVGGLTSLKKQTFKDFEVICVNDGSTDNSLSVVESFVKKDKRFHVVSQKNKGLSGARNTGIQQAQGSYVYFMDSDDYLHPQALEILYHLMTKYDAEIAGIGLRKTSVLYGDSFPEINLHNYKIKKYNQPFDAFLHYRSVMSGVCTRLYKREIFNTIHFVEGIYFEDVPFTTMVMSQINSMVVCDAPLYYYYQNPSSIIHTSFNIKKLKSYSIVIQTIYRYIMETCPYYIQDVRKCILNQRFKMMLNQSIRKQKDPQKRIELFDEIQKIVLDLYPKDMLSFDGLKLKHKIALFLLLKEKTTLARKWMAFWG